MGWEQDVIGQNPGILHIIERILLNYGHCGDFQLRFSFTYYSVVAVSFYEW